MKLSADAVTRLIRRWLRWRAAGVITADSYWAKVIALQRHLLHMQIGCRWCNPRPWHR